MLQVLFVAFTFVIKSSKVNGVKNAMQLFQQLQKFSQNLAGFLKTKFPKGQNVQAGQLAKQFKQFDCTDQFDFDMLVHAGVIFKTKGKIISPQSQTNDKPTKNIKFDSIEITNTIKVLLNKLMDELDQKFPKFRDMIKQIDPNFKVGRKISQNTARYTKLDTGVIQIKSPQIARVLIKWMEDLKVSVEQPQKVFNLKNQIKVAKFDQYNDYFSVKEAFNRNKTDHQKQQFGQSNPIKIVWNFISRTQVPWNNNKTQQIDEKTLKYQKCNQKTLQKIINEGLLNKIKEKQQDYKKDQNRKINQQHFQKFSINLLKDLQNATLDQAQVSNKQMQVIKCSYSISNLIYWIVEEKLINYIKILVESGQNYVQQNGVLNLIKFKVNDLMRCQLVGNKSDLKRAYRNLILKEKNKQLQIIKVKNRFQSFLSDSTIYFKMTNSFIICECQLVLSQSTGSSDATQMKNTEDLNHFLYQLERSPFGIIGELSIFLKKNSDAVNFYYDKIKLKISQRKKEMIRNCSEIKMKKQKLRYVSQKQPKQTNQSYKQQKFQLRPFVCSVCFKYYKKLTMKQFHFCQECQSTLCDECLQNIISQNNKFSNDPENSVIKLKNNRELWEAQAKILQYIIKKNTRQDSRCLFKQYHYHDTFRHLPNQVWRKDNSSIIKVQQLMNYFQKSESKAIKKGWKIYFAIYTEIGSQIKFALYRYDSDQKSIQNVYSPIQKYMKHQSIQMSKSSFIFLFKNMSRIKVIKQNKTKLFDGKGIQQIFNIKILAFDHQQKYQNANQLRSQIQADNQDNHFVYYVKGRDAYRDNKKILFVLLIQIDKSKQIQDNESIKKILYNLPQLKNMKQSIDLSNLGATSLQFQFLKKQLSFQQVQRLYSNTTIESPISKTNQKIQNLPPSSQSALGIQNSSQFISNFLHQKPLDWIKNTKIMNLSDNKLKDLSLILQVCLKLVKLDVSSNKLQVIQFKRPLKRLVQLQAQNNLISQIKGFQNIGNIEIMNIKINKFINFQIQQPLNKLKQIMISFNNFNQVVLDKALNLRHIQADQIHLNDYKLEKMLFKQQNNCKFTELEILSIKGNNFRILPNFSKFTKLSKLNLDQNYISIKDKNLKENLQIILSRNIQFSFPIMNQYILAIQYYKKVCQLALMVQEYKLTFSFFDLEQFNEKSSNNSQSEQKPKTQLTHQKVIDKESDNKDNKILNLGPVEKDRQYLYVKYVMGQDRYVDYYYIRDRQHPQLCILRHWNAPIDIDEFIQFSWSNLSQIDISSCQIDDSAWKKLVQISKNFINLTKIQIWDNQITEIRQNDLQSFKALKEIWFFFGDQRTKMTNLLTTQSLQIIQKFNFNYNSQRWAFASVLDSNKYAQINMNEIYNAKSVTIKKKTFDQIADVMIKLPKNLTELIIKRTQDDGDDPFDFDVLDKNKKIMRVFHLIPTFKLLKRFQFWTNFSKHGAQNQIVNHISQLENLQYVGIYDKYNRFNKDKDIQIKTTQLRTQLYPSLSKKKIQYVIKKVNWE